MTDRRSPVGRRPRTIGSVLLSEELALVALDPRSGRPPLGVRAELNACLAGLLIGELVIDGFAAPGNDERDVVLTRTPLGPPALAAAAGVVAGEGPRIKATLSAMDRRLHKELGTGTWDAAVAGLVAAGIVGPPDGTIRPRHEILDPAVGEAVVARLQAAARGESGDLRTALLLSMAGPAHLLEIVAPERSGRRDARRRIDHALDGTPLAPIGKTVRKLITANQSAAAVPGVVG